MRNWNAHACANFLRLYACFYSTYEELKPKFMDFIKYKIYGFYSTYEELKLVRT